jgi:hypothetical protein
MPSAHFVLQPNPKADALPKRSRHSAQVQDAIDADDQATGFATSFRAPSLTSFLW